MIKDMAEKGNYFGDDANEKLEKMADELDAGYDMRNDKGSIALMEDLTALLYEAFHYEFHDFKNSKHATPKMELVKRLEEMVSNVKNGKYDN